MIETSHLSFNKHLLFAAGTMLVLCAGGCGREEITTYRVPKEVVSPSVASHPTESMAAMAGLTQSAKPGIAWQLPAGWTEKPGSKMRAGSFALPGGEGEVAIIPLPMAEGVAAETINMWRGEMGLKSISAGDVAKEATSLPIASGQGQTLTASNGTNTSVMAWLNQAGTLWLFKMSGASTPVEAQKSSFNSFLQSITFKAPAASMAAAPRASAQSGGTAGNAHAEWKVPEGWRSSTPGPMVMASYKVGAEGGPSADVSVSMFPGDVGGTLANVNRWRGQLGQAALTEADLATATTTVDVGGTPGISVDFSGTNARSGKAARMAGLIVARGANTWFYKLMGDDAVVAAEKSKLIQFAGDAH